MNLRHGRIFYSPGCGQPAIPAVAHTLESTILDFIFTFTVQIDVCAESVTRRPFSPFSAERQEFFWTSLKSLVP